jgi:hypothetical protein
MKLSELSPQVIERIKAYRWDRIIEKHEGPEDWASVLEFYAPEFMVIEGRHVLLPVNREQHPNMTVLRCVVSKDGQTLTLFLRDTTYVHDPADEKFMAGFLAVCDRVPGEEFFIAVVYHEWFIIENP